MSASIEYIKQVYVENPLTIVFHLLYDEVVLKIEITCGNAAGAIYIRKCMEDLRWLIIKTKLKKEEHLP